MSAISPSASRACGMSRAPSREHLQSPTARGHADPVQENRHA